MINNLWLQLQEVRRLIKLLNKHTSPLEDTPSGFVGIVDADGKFVYEARNFEQHHTLTYASYCVNTGSTPNVIDLNNFDPDY